MLKLGTQHSIQRFYAIYCLGADRARREQFYASLVQMPALISSILCFAVIGATALLNLFRPIANIQYLLVVLLAGQINVFFSLIDNIIRAKEHSALTTRVNIASRYLSVAMVISVILLISPTAMGVYLTRVLCTTAAVLFLAWWGLRNCDFNLRAFSPALFRQSLLYGLPLVLSEFSFILLAFADRVMLMPLGCSKDELGVYTIGYGLAMFVGTFITNALIPAYQPVANRIYETQGREAVVRLQRQLLRILYYAAVAIAVGMLFVGRDLVVFYCGQKYADAAPVFQWIGFNYVLYPIFLILSYGLNLTKKTAVISWIVLFSAAVNIGLNFILIPRLHFMGAVYATLICYLLMGVLQMVFCPKGYLPTPRPGDLLRPLGLGALMFGVAQWTGLFGLHHPLARLGVMILIFAATFAAPMLAIDRDLRQQIFKKLRRSKGRIV